MIRAYTYLMDKDITDRGLSFRVSPIRAGNTTPRGLYYHAFLADKTPVLAPFSNSRWHAGPEYTQNMHYADQLKSFFDYYYKQPQQ